jgi:uncharacterized protein YndB with AHSA1/START domain
MRAHHVVVDRDFSKSPERVFAYLAEHENLAEIFGAKVTRLSDGQHGHRNGVGSVRQLQIGPLPAFEETVTEFVPSERIVYEITKGSPLKGHLGVMTFTSQGQGGTHLHYDIRLASPIPGVAAIVQAALTRSVEKGLGKVEQDA